eukprot:11435736-Alexandrium_andersonii.AAC.1
MSLHGAGVPISASKALDSFANMSAQAFGSFKATHAWDHVSHVMCAPCHRWGPSCANASWSNGDRCSRTTLPRVQWRQLRVPRPPVSAHRQKHVARGSWRRQFVYAPANAA